MKCLLIDINNLFAKFYYANKEVCVKLIIKNIWTMLSYFNATHCCCVFDSEAKNFRYEIYPEYKSKRTKPEDYDHFRQKLKEALKLNGIPQISSKSLEAEDSINLIVKNNPNVEFIVLSEDKDCLLLNVHKNCQVYKQQKINEDTNEREKFKLLAVPDYCSVSIHDSLFIEKYKLFFSLKGDSADNIPGVPKFGNVYSNFIVSIFDSYQNLKDFLSNVSIYKIYGITNQPDKLEKCVETIKKNENFLDLSYKLFCLFDTDKELKIDISQWRV